MGMRYAGDPDWGYRLPRSSLVSVLALERVEATEREAAQGPGKGRPARKGLTLAHPQVVCTSSEAARFWGLS